MGVIGKILGAGAGNAAGAIGQAVEGVAEVFTPNATRAMELSAQAQMGALTAMGAEFSASGKTKFDSFINGLNRMPRPLLALGTVALFVFAMFDPAAFAQRMVGLNAVPEPLWWLLGAVVAFYFGARETHYFRAARGASGQVVIPQAVLPSAPTTLVENPALRDWQGGK